MPAIDSRGDKGQTSDIMNVNRCPFNALKPHSNAPLCEITSVSKALQWFWNDFTLIVHNYSALDQIDNRVFFSTFSMEKTHQTNKQSELILDKQMNIGNLLIDMAVGQMAIDTVDFVLFFLFRSIYMLIQMWIDKFNKRLRMRTETEGITIAWQFIDRHTASGLMLLDEESERHAYDFGCKRNSIFAAVSGCGVNENNKFATWNVSD